ncbi:MAG: response regulator [Promethearchaeota archaeon]|nr:MAG: response regulator [Candidatus Lokiarchaeota archaeon]
MPIKMNKKINAVKAKFINPIKELSIPTFIIDSNHNVIEWNKAIKNLTGVRRKEILGTSNAWKAFYSEKRPTLADLLLDGKIEEIETYFQNFSKAKHCLRGYTAEKWLEINYERLYLIMTATAILDKKGEIIQIIQTIEDRTESKHIKDRKEFLNSIFRHDANNMINVCHGFLKLLEKTELTEVQKDYLQEAINASRGVISIIEKVSKLQKVGREETQDLSLGDLIQEIVNKNQFQAKEKGITIEVCLPEFSSNVQAGELLEDVFINIIGNSLQHSQCDKIKISGRESKDAIICCIEDNGKGIKEEDKEMIFNQGFKRGKSAGSGLGLFLVKKITNNYGAKVYVKDSQLGGVKFEVQLKKSKGRPEKRRNSLSQIENDFHLTEDSLLNNEHHLQNLIVVVDDNLQFLTYMKVLLENYDYKVETFRSAVNALSYIENQDYHSIPDLIISDIRMPELSGYEFFKNLSSNPKLNRIPFIFLSGLSSKDDIRLGKYLGADDYITKPVYEEDILASIKGKLRRKKAGSVFETEIDKYLNLEQKRDNKLENMKFDEEIVLFLIFWDDKKGPKLIEQYPEKSRISLSVDKLGTQIFQAIVPIYGQSKNIVNAEDVLFRIENINKHAYLYFDAFYDESKRSKQTEFMLSVIAPTISYFESLKLKKILSNLSNILKEDNDTKKINFRQYWKDILGILSKFEN